MENNEKLAYKDFLFCIFAYIGVSNGKNLECKNFEWSRLTEPRIIKIEQRILWQ